MRYRTKLYLALIFIAVVSSSAGLGIMYVEARRFVWEELRSKAITVAATTAAFLDGDSIKLILSRSDENSPAYIKIRDQLRKARDVNRRDLINIHYLYTLRPDPEDKKTMLFVVDAEEDPKEFSHVGDFDAGDAESHIDEHLNEFYSPDKYVSDIWGIWLSGYAPVYDSQGQYVATVGADISASKIQERLSLLLYDGILGLLGAVFLAFLGGFFLARRVTYSLATLCQCVEKIGQGDLDQQVTLYTSDEFEDLAQAINKMTAGLKERERLKMNFARYVSHHVLDAILKSDKPTKLEGERRKVTILFSDIRQFTHLSEALPPEQVVALLNEYFAIMLDVIFKYQGTLDKFLGDGIMVEFGVPLDDPMQELHAIGAAIEMQQQLHILCTRWLQEGKPHIDMGIGIHTGLAVVGNIGSEKRMEYTAIGDTVNVAARLEQATKILKTPILVSETTYTAIKDKYHFHCLGPITLPGKTLPITVYSIEEHK